MKKLFAGAAAAALLTAGSAYAAPVVNVTGPSGTFGNDNVVCANNAVTCSFSDTINFATPTGFSLQSATISTIMAGLNMATNIDFSSVTLNGISFGMSPTGAYESGAILNQPVPTNGLNTLIIAGTVGSATSTSPANASYSGTLSFAAGAVPEPAAWAMMIVGMGAIGFAMRRQKVTTRVAFAA